MDAMNFGEALAAVKAGKRIARSGWNGKGMFLFLVETWAFDDGNYYAHLKPVYNGHPFIAMKTADDRLVPWLASQTDILAADWAVLV